METLILQGCTKRRIALTVASFLYNDKLRPFKWSRNTNHASLYSLLIK